MSELNIRRVRTLPAVLVPNTIYLVGQSGTRTYDMVTSNDAGAPFYLKSEATRAEVVGLLNAKVDKVTGMGLSANSFSTAEKIKLTEIQAQATKNDTDANLKNRANQTGYQNMDTVSGLVPALAEKARLISGRFVTNAQELSDAMNAIPDQAEIFNSWKKISNNASMVFPAIPAETTAWAYNEQTKRVRNTTNSSSFIAAISDRKFEQYELLVAINSTDGDDDGIGLVLAFFEDSAGRQYTLSLSRSPGGVATLYTVVYNLLQGVPGEEYVVSQGNPLTQWGNGASGALTKTEAGMQNNAPGWAGVAAWWGTDGTQRLWVKRTGDIIQTMTSTWANPTVLDPASLMTIDLTSDIRLEKFRGPSNYGFSAYSQANSYWNTLQFINPQDAIYDLSTKKVYSHNGTNWVESTSITFASLGKQVFLSNSVTGRLFYIQDNSKVIALNSTPI